MFLSLQAAVQVVHVAAVQHRAEEGGGQPAVLHVPRAPQLLLPAHVLDGHSLRGQRQPLAASPAPPPGHHRRRQKAARRQHQRCRRTHRRLQARTPAHPAVRVSAEHAGGRLAVTSRHPAAAGLGPALAARPQPNALLRGPAGQRRPAAASSAGRQEAQPPAPLPPATRGAARAAPAGGRAGRPGAALPDGGGQQPHHEGLAGRIRGQPTVDCTALLAVPLQR